MINKRKICALLLVILLFVQTQAQAFSISATGACTMDFETGEFLYEKNGDTLMTPASLTKIMTLYIVFEKIAAGELSKDTTIYISENAALLSRSGDATNIPLYSGEAITLGTLIDAMVIVSACASCSAVAEHISGSEDAFAQLMNEKAAELGIEAYFTDASGLSDYNLISPKGVARLVQLFIKNYPDILNHTKKTSAVIRGKEYKATNMLLPLSDKNYYYSGVDGFKTGTTTLAGKCLAATAEKNGTRVISVSMKSPTNLRRYQDAAALLDSAFLRTEYLNSNLFETDIKAYINGDEIPCSYSLGKKKALCITAENLNYYGFDTYYDAAVSTLYIYENSTKPITPIPSEKKEPGTPLYKIYSPSSLQVIFVKDGIQTPLETVFSLNGQCCISFDELGRLFSSSWDDAARSAYIFTN